MFLNIKKFLIKIINKLKEFVFGLTLEKVLRLVLTFVLNSLLTFFLLYLFNVQFNVGVVSCMAYPEKINFLDAFSNSVSTKERLTVLGMSLGISLLSCHFCKTIVVPYIISCWSKTNLDYYTQILDKNILTPLSEEAKYVTQLETEINHFCHDYKKFLKQYDTVCTINENVQRTLIEALCSSSPGHYIIYNPYNDHLSYEDKVAYYIKYYSDFKKYSYNTFDSNSTTCVIHERTQNINNFLNSEIAHNIRELRRGEYLMLNYLKKSLGQDLPLLKQHILELNKSVSKSKVDSLYAILSSNELRIISNIINQLKIDTSDYLNEIVVFNHKLMKVYNKYNTRNENHLILSKLCDETTCDYLMKDFKDLNESLIKIHTQIHVLTDYLSPFYSVPNVLFWTSVNYKHLSTFHDLIKNSLFKFKDDSYFFYLLKYRRDVKDEFLFNSLYSFTDFGYYAPSPGPVSLHDKSPCSQLIPFNWEDFI